jgi:type IV pilus assembly protein PilE
MRKLIPSRRQGTGFTLIELMIVVTIIAILAAVAVPTWFEQAKKGKRAEGKARLSAAAQRLERYYSDNSTYTTDLGLAMGLGTGTTVYSDDGNSNKSAYVITSTAATGGIAVGYTLKATPNGSFVDAKCNVLSLTNTGVKGATGTGGVADCW